MPFFSGSDALGRPVTLPAPPQRIISLVPSQTELLVTLGLEDRLAGITRFCVRPEGLTEETTIIGGTKQINKERIMDLRPDLVLANVEENTQDIVQELEAEAPVYVTNVGALPEAVSMIHTVGRLTDTTEVAEGLVYDITSLFNRMPSYERRRAVYLIWRSPYMTVGRDTFIHDIMERGGFVNVFRGQRRYPEVHMDDLKRLSVDVLLLPNEPYPFTEEHAQYLRAQMPTTQVLLADGQAFSWYGSRLLHTPQYLTRLREQLDHERRMQSLSG